MEAEAENYDLLTDSEKITAIYGGPENLAKLRPLTHREFYTELKKRALEYSLREDFSELTRSLYHEELKSIEEQWLKLCEEHGYDEEL